MPDSILWFRRDLRLGDQPALLRAAEDADGGRVLPLFVVDPRLTRCAGSPRLTWLVRSLRALDRSLGSMDGSLLVRHGDPAEVVADVAAELGAATVHVTADAGPYGRRRDEAVRETLHRAGRSLVGTGSPYAVGPGSVTKRDGTPYAVFTPFARAWRDHGWPAPAPTPPRGLRWAAGLDGAGLPDEPDEPGEPDRTAVELPDVGEQAAHERWEAFLDEGLDGYAETRDRPAHAGTSRMSAHLKYGEIHPRTMLAGMVGRGSKGAEVFRTELAWREFYADVLWHRPDSLREYLRPEFARLRYSPPGWQLEAWQAGQTGFPLVDAGMRQLAHEGWMHNRVRMVTASFLLKDLHVEWQHGARHFMRHLLDGDVASNTHNWQWAAGSGTDAAPYVRVFNPVTQGLRFDPDGRYVRRYVPELAHLEGSAAHTPWDHADGYAHGYPQRIVDHAVERQEALDRLAETRR